VTNGDESSLRRGAVTHHLDGAQSMQAERAEETLHRDTLSFQRWEVTKFIHSSNVLKYNFEILIL